MSNLKLTRQELASFLGDHLKVRQFEKLFSQVSSTDQENIAFIEIIAETANASASGAQSMLFDLKEDIESQLALLDARLTQGLSYSFSVASSNGFSGTVSTDIPAIVTLSTTASGVLKGSSGSITAASPGIDYQPPIKWYLLSGQTVGASSVNLLTNSGLMVLPNNSIWAYSFDLSARNATGSERASFYGGGAIYRNANAASTTLEAGNYETVIYKTDAALAVTISANTTSGALNVSCAGKSGETINWTATFRVNEAT